MDCGLFQGVKNLRELNWAPLAIPPSSIDAVVVTHAHLDHSGYLPRLVRDGFRGPIYATAATDAVAEIILARQRIPAGAVTRRSLNKHKASKHHPALPLYDSEDARTGTGVVHAPSVRAGVHHRARSRGDVSACRAHSRGGHRRRWHGPHRIVFTGDLGRYDDPMHARPGAGEPRRGLPGDGIDLRRPRARADRTPPTSSREVIEQTTVKRGGTVVIPAFAVGRAQTLLYHLWLLRKAGRLPDVPVYLDSPMAINASELLCAHPGDLKLSPEV